MEMISTDYAGCDALLSTMRAVYLDHAMPIYRVLNNSKRISFK